MIARFSKLKISTRVGWGFLLVTLILIGAVLFTIQQVLNMKTINERIINLRVPTVQTSLSLLNGINHSLAGLRGWMLLEQTRFKEERARAWANEIEPSLRAMQGLSSDWANLKDAERLRIIEKKLEAFRKYQVKIETLAHTPKNTPANKILFEKAVPVEKEIIQNISKMIELEMQVKPSPKRKALLGIMGDIENTMSMVMMNIEAYLMSGEEKFKNRFKSLWATKTRLYKDLESRQALLTPDQKTAFQKLGEARKRFEPLPQQMVAIRTGEGWNLANLWLGTRAAPTAFAIKNLLDEMVASQNSLLAAEEKEIRERTHFLILILLSLLFGGGLISGVLGSSITRDISKQMESIVNIEALLSRKGPGRT